MSSPQWDPSVHKRRLHRALRQARETAGLTQQDVATEMEWSPSKVIRIEAGTVTITINDLKALLNLYGVHDPARVTELIDSARIARTKSPLDRYKPYLLAPFISYLAYESIACTLRNFEPWFVPGLLQTDEYAKEIVQTTRGAQDQNRITALVELRMNRQQELIEKDGLELFFMLDESVIRRPVLTADALGRQLDHLLDQADRPGVHVRVIPFAEGVYSRPRVPYVVLEFPDIEQPSVLFREYPERDEIIVGDEGEIAEETSASEPAATPAIYTEIFMELEAKTSEKASKALIREARKAL
jgi:transcriptional regulator with XRE-family HTH domain